MNGPRRKTGPKPRAGSPATERLELRLTVAERRAWERAAGERTLSEWLRDVAAKAIG